MDHLRLVVIPYAKAAAAYELSGRFFQLQPPAKTTNAKLRPDILAAISRAING